MAKLRYPIRIHWRHDPDIYTFISTHEFSFLKALYCAVTAFSKGEVFVIDVPPRKKDAIIGKRKPYYYVLILDEDIDGDAIQLIDQIARNYRNSFFRNLLRLYLCMPISEEFLINKENIDDFESKFQIFRNGKRVAKAGKLARKPRNGYISAEDKLKSVFEDVPMDAPVQSLCIETDNREAGMTGQDPDAQNMATEPGSADIEPKQRKKKKYANRTKNPRISSVRMEQPSDKDCSMENKKDHQDNKDKVGNSPEKEAVPTSENGQDVVTRDELYIEPPDSGMDILDKNQDGLTKDPLFTEPDEHTIEETTDSPADEDDLTDFFFSLVG